MEAIWKFLKRSPWVYHVGTSGCNNCDIEILDCLTPRFDIERFGIKLVGSPRHADILLVSGPVATYCKKPLEQIYREVSKPCLVACIGVCACSMGIFKDAYSVDGPPDKVIRSVDPNAKFIYIPGCPPRPEAIIMGIVKAFQSLKGEAV
ncbi:NADH-quinone oxidoreductase subunit B family protein [candidate division KSB1 bacterium]